MIKEFLGLTEAANRALESANLYRGAARDLAEGARAPLESWQALRDAVRGTDEASADALTEATGAAERLETALGDAGRAATGAGAAAGKTCWPSILIRPMWISLDSRLAAGSPARSPLVRRYASAFMSLRRKAISTLRSASMACTQRRTRCWASAVATMVLMYR